MNVIISQRVFNGMDWIQNFNNNQVTQSTRNMLEPPRIIVSYGPDGWFYNEHLIELFISH